MSLIVMDLLKEEYQELELRKDSNKSYDFIRTALLKDALRELESIALKSDCLSCRHNVKQEDLSDLNDEEYLAAFDKCRTCKNYYPNNFEEK